MKVQYEDSASEDRLDLGEVEEEEEEGLQGKGGRHNPVLGGILKLKPKHLLLVFLAVLIILSSLATLNRKGYTANPVQLSNQNNVPDNSVQCLGHNNVFEYYLTVVTLIKNKREYVREWIEFHLMMGISHFIFYDQYSVDGLEAVLRPYIDDGKVTLITWPPKEFPKENWKDDKVLENHFNTNMEKCFEDKFVPCQKSAFDDAIRRTRGKTRWFSAIDVDEFYYIPQNSTLWKNYPEAPLMGAFKNLEKYHGVTVYGQHFGTSGWLSPPRRDDNQQHSQLITKTRTRHMQYTPGELIKVSEHRKPFVNPSCVVYNEVHDYQWGYELSWKSTYHNTYDIDEATIMMNHYLWPSYIENVEKAIINRNPNTGYDPDYDHFINKEVGSEIEYLLPKLEERMKVAIYSKPAVDGHGDDWDNRLETRHNRNALANPDLCVILWKPLHIGLARHALSSIINYFYRVENTLHYKLILLGGNHTDELKRDFPIDDSIESELEIQEHCSADVVLRLNESAFARWEMWPLEKPAIKLGLKLLSNNILNKVSLTDSSNLMGQWSVGKDQGTEDYRKNFGQKSKEALLIRKSVIMNDEKEETFEMCLHTQDLCPDNRVRSLFEVYHQERMYGYEPGFVL